MPFSPHNAPCCICWPCGVFYYILIIPCLAAEWNGIYRNQVVKSRITLQKALGTVVWHRAGGFALVQALLPDRLFIINGIVIANRVFGGNIGGFGGGFLLGFQRCLVIGKGVQGVSAHFIHNACRAGAAQVA